MIETLIKFLRGLGKGKLMCSGFAKGHSAKTSKKPCFPSKARTWSWSALVTSKQHALSPSSPASTTQPQLLQVPGLAQTYIMELRELFRLDSVAAQLIKHRRSPPLCEGQRGPMVSYFGTLTVFHSAPSQTIVSRRQESALDVL